MHDPWTPTMVRGLPEEVGVARWRRSKGGKIRTTVIAQSRKYNLKKKKAQKLRNTILIKEQESHTWPCV